MSHSELWNFMTPRFKTAVIHFCQQQSFQMHGYSFMTSRKRLKFLTFTQTVVHTSPSAALSNSFYFSFLFTTINGGSRDKGPRSVHGSMFRYVNTQTENILFCRRDESLINKGRLFDGLWNLLGVHVFVCVFQVEWQILRAAASQTDIN